VNQECLGCKETRNNQKRFTRHLVFFHNQDLPCAEARDLLETLDILEAKLKEKKTQANCGEITWG